MMNLSDFAQIKIVFEVWYALNPGKINSFIIVFIFWLNIEASRMEAENEECSFAENYQILTMLGDGGQAKYLFF